jgi:hypothetical protein
MCSEGVAGVFRKAYPFLGIFTTLICLYIVTIFPPLHVEMYSTSVRPINGTLQVILCDTSPLGMTITMPDGRVVTHCERVVDQPARLQVNVYHSSMGIPFIICCMIGTIFCHLTKKEKGMVFNVNLMFVPDTYAPVQTNADYGIHEESSSLYTWEIVFWAYVFALHGALVACLTSPVDVFDAAVAVLFGTLCFMFLCRPRGNNMGAATMQGLVLSTLIVCTWLTFTSIPHAYQQDRLWLMGVLTTIDGLLLLIHMYDSLPTMYTIVMGRLTYITLGNMLFSLAFATLEDRLSEVVHNPMAGLEAF